MKLGRTLFALSAVLALVGAAQARPTSYTSNVSGLGVKNWNDAANWTPNTGYPVAGDTATIVAGDTITVASGQAAANVNVAASGVLDVTTGGALTVSSAVSVSGQLQINNNGQVSADDVTVASGGLLQLNGGDSDIAELLFPSGAASPTLTINQADGVVMVASARIRVAKNMTFAGSGSLQGQVNAVEIAIDTDASPDVTLTTELLIHGGLTVKKHDAGAANAKLVNSGEFRADVNGLTITFASSLNDLDDSAGTPRWYASVSGAAMVFDENVSTCSGQFRVGTGAAMTFNEASSSLTSHFVLDSNGLFVFNAGLTTNGSFTIYCGSNVIEVDVNNGASFIYGSVGASSNCTSGPPATTINTDFDCACSV